MADINVPFLPTLLCVWVMIFLHDANFPLVQFSHHRVFSIFKHGYMLKTKHSDGKLLSSVCTLSVEEIDFLGDPKLLPSSGESRPTNMEADKNLDNVDSDNTVIVDKQTTASIEEPILKRDFAKSMNYKDLAGSEVDDSNAGEDFVPKAATPPANYNLQGFSTARIEAREFDKTCTLDKNNSETKCAICDKICDSMIELHEHHKGSHGK